MGMQMTAEAYYSYICSHGVKISTYNARLYGLFTYRT